MTASAYALAVPRGSLIVLSGVYLGDEDPVPESMLAEIESAIGHDRFAVLTLPGDGEVQVIGPDEDLIARLVELGIPAVGT